MAQPQQTLSDYKHTIEGSQSINNYTGRLLISGSY
jgi:hypothetical protein